MIHSDRETNEEESC